VLDANGKPLGNVVQGTLTITSGKGLFPTGTSFTFTTRGGQDGIEFRSYDAGPVTLTATADGLTAGTLDLSILPPAKR
jgi:hypothetical protein